MEILKTLAWLQKNITCGNVCGEEDTVCQPSVATGPAGKPDRVTYLGFPCAPTPGALLGQREIQIACGGSAGNRTYRTAVLWNACHVYKEQNPTPGWNNNHTRDTKHVNHRGLWLQHDFLVPCARQDTASNTATRFSWSLVMSEVEYAAKSTVC